MIPESIVEWITSSYSAGNGACVQMGWEKSSYSADTAACVEVGTCSRHGVLIRDSKNPDGPVLLFTKEVWATFIAGVKANEFNI